MHADQGRLIQLMGFVLKNKKNLNIVVIFL